MKHFLMDEMVKGWFIGGFSPAAFNSEACEVAVKHYCAGDYEDLHHHKIATEITVIVSGQVRMLGQTWVAGDIIVLPPGTATNFEALTDAVNVVVKIPGTIGDKYLGSGDQ
jgi:quercetin dioxygenase-like cupin family protein